MPARALAWCIVILGNIWYIYFNFSGFMDVVIPAASLAGFICLRTSTVRILRALFLIFGTADTLHFPHGLRTTFTHLFFRRTIEVNKKLQVILHYSSHFSWLAFGMAQI
jgi:hypothetical protein